MVITKHIQSSYALFLLIVLAFVLFNSMLPGITYYAVIFCVLVFLSKDARAKFDRNALLTYRRQVRQALDSIKLKKD